MAYKTILVHLNDERRAEHLLQTAVKTARDFDAHLIGLYVFPAFRVGPPVPFPVGGDIGGSIKAQLRKEAERVHAIFEAQTRLQPIVAEWRSVTVKRRDPAEIVIEQSFAADLVMASQSDPDWILYPSLDFPERLAIEGVRPVVLVPNSTAPIEPMKRILVAWNGKREAARAMLDALPFLQRAEEVVVLSLDEGTPGREAPLPDTEFASALARHGVKVTAASGSTLSTSVGEAIASRALSMKAGLIVMGCYGHSRLFEFVFGGASRHMLKAMPVPVLLSH